MNTEFIENQDYNKKLENASLGACLIEKTGFSSLSGRLKEKMLYQDGSRVVYKAMAALHECCRPIDMYTVLDQIINVQKIDNINGDNIPYYLSRLTDSVVSSANLPVNCIPIGKPLSLQQSGREMDG